MKNKIMALVICWGLLITGTGARRKMAWTYVITNQPSGDPKTEQWKIDNAQEIWNYFRNAGYTEESTAAIIGNMCSEGTLNPGQIEWNHDPNDPLSGRGLIGWTPGTKIINYAQSEGYNWYDGYIQCKFLDTRPDVNWIPRSWTGYTYTWAQFKQLTNIEIAVYAFFWEAEYGTASTIPYRLECANYFYEMFTGIVPPPPGPTPPPTPQPPGGMDMKIIGGRDVMRRVWYKH